MWTDYKKCDGLEKGVDNDLWRCEDGDVARVAAARVVGEGAEGMHEVEKTA